MRGAKPSSTKLHRTKLITTQQLGETLVKLGGYPLSTIDQPPKKIHHSAPPGGDFPCAPHALQQLRGQHHHHGLGGTAQHVEEQIQVIQLVAVLGE